MSGLDAPVSPCLQFRLRSFPPSLPSPSVSSSLPAPTCSASTSGSDCPPPARLTRAKVRATVHYSQDSASGSCRGLRPCLLCYLCPATATAIAVAASGPKQHRPVDERPLRPQCEVQRHHPPEGRCWGYIFFSLGAVVLPHACFLCNTLSGTLYIIDNLPLFDYLYIGFEGVVTALNVCLIILQDTSELPMCLRLVAPILY